MRRRKWERNAIEGEAPERVRSWTQLGRFGSEPPSWCLGSAKEEREREKLCAERRERKKIRRERNKGKKKEINFF
jgi:hypothetical protein